MEAIDELAKFTYHLVNIKHGNLIIKDIQITKFTYHLVNIKLLGILILWIDDT
ncbi:MAG: hypothetical protein ACRCXA_03590 [Peptostreptococcaceae bacterium]